MGDRITISGTIQNSNLNIKSTLTNVQQTIDASPEAETLSGAAPAVVSLAAQIASAILRMRGMA